MFLDEKTVLEIWLNPGLNLTIFRGTGPRATKTTVTPPRGFKTVRKCLTLGTIPDFRFLEKA